MHAALKRQESMTLCPALSFDLLPEAERVLALFNGKWAVRIIHCLAQGPRRHGQLRRTLAPISQKVLTSTLRDLEAAGLVRRHILGSKAPFATTYSLTDSGAAFLEPLQAICRWAKEHQAGSEENLPRRHRDTEARRK